MTCFPPTALVNERYIHIGAGTIIGPHVALSAGMVPGQQCVSDRVVRSGTAASSAGERHRRPPVDRDRRRRVDGSPRLHHRPEPRHRRPRRPISAQVMPERPVRIGAGSWLGDGTVVLPGATIGRHVVVGAGSVVAATCPTSPRRRQPRQGPQDPRTDGFRGVSGSLCDPHRRQKLRSWGGAQAGILVVGGEDLQLVAEGDAVRRRSR